MPTGTTPQTTSAVHQRPGTEVPHTHGASDNKEVPTVMLTNLIDHGCQAVDLGEELPCRVNDPELWFAERPSDIEFAKALCGTCPLQAMCLAGALEREEPWGVWGGELFQAGAVIARKRPRGRPRKHPVAA